MLKVCGAVGLAIGLMLPGLAAADTYECKLAREASGYVPQVFYFGIEAGATTAKVDDGIIEYFNKSPMDAPVTKDTDAVLKFNWAVLMINGSGQRTKMAYKATFFRADGSIDIFARPAGYGNDFSSRGSCVKKQ